MDECAKGLDQKHRLVKLIKDKGWHEIEFENVLRIQLGLECTGNIRNSIKRRWYSLQCLSRGLSADAHPDPTLNFMQWAWARQEARAELTYCAVKVSENDLLTETTTPSNIKCAFDDQL